MTVKIHQTITQVEPAVYKVALTVDDGEPIEEVFTRSNAVFPVYRTLTKALYSFADCPVEVTTNSPQLVHEFNNEANSNATLLTHLKDVAARRGIDLTIKAADGL